MAEVVRNEEYQQSAERSKQLISLMQQTFFQLHCVHAVDTIKGDISEQNMKDITHNSIQRVIAITNLLLDNDEVSFASEIITKFGVALCDDFLSVVRKK